MLFFYMPFLERLGDMAKLTSWLLTVVPDDAIRFNVELRKRVQDFVKMHVAI
jgi:hypothetical protein